jgi:spermidine synthase
VQGKLSSPEYARVAQSLRDVGFNSAIDLFSTYAGQDQDLRGWLHDAAINRDGNLRLQYLAGLALNISAEGAIYNQMLSYRQFPFNLFKGSEQTLRNLAAAMGPRQP